MMYSFLLRTTVRLLIPLTLLFSLFVLLRGHSEPGGGFVGGLVAAAGFVLYSLSIGVAEAQRALRLAPQTISTLGLTCSIVAGLIPVAQGRPFLTSLWLKVPMPVGPPLELGTTLLFDIGVYLVVVGTVLLIVFALETRALMSESES